jgi:hypothetical protein
MPSEERRRAWESTLADQQSSGLSVSEWCKRQSIALSTFSYWRKRLKELANPQQVIDGAAAQREHPQWLTMEVAADPRPSPVALTLRIGRVSLDVTTGFDPHLLADVLTVLEARC